MRLWLFLTVAALAMRSMSAQQPGEPTATVLAAVAPVYTPIAVLANVSGDVSVEVRIGSDGKVNATKAVNGNKLLIHTSLEAAKQWRFETGASDRNAILKFLFRILPKGTPEEELSTVFLLPFSIEIRRTIPEQMVNFWVHKHNKSKAIFCCTRQEPTNDRDQSKEQDSPRTNHATGETLGLSITPDHHTKQKKTSPNDTDS